MQGMSPQVNDGEATLGEFRTSTTNELVGGVEAPFRVVPLYMKNQWVEYQVLADGDTKFLGILDIDQTNHNAPYEWSEDGFNYKRQKIMTFFVLLESDLAEGTSMPYVLVMKGTSSRAGKKLLTTMYMLNKSRGRAPWGTVCEVSAKIVKEKNRSYAVMDVKEVGVLASDHDETAATWVNAVTAQSVTVDSDNGSQTSASEEDIPF